MGWASGNEVFDSVADALISANASDQVTQTVCAVLIGRLLDKGWDTAEESMALYEDHPPIIAAFKEHGFFFKCCDETDDGDLCEERQNHRGDHKDYQGKTWPHVPECSCDAEIRPGVGVIHEDICATWAEELTS